MRILHEQIILIADFLAQLVAIKEQLDEALALYSKELHTEIIDNIVRIYFEEKSICSIRIDQENMEIFVIEDYQGYITVANIENIIDKAISIVKNLNYDK